MARRRGRLTLRERQSLRRGEKVYRDGVEIDRDGNPVHQEEAPTELAPDHPDYVPGETAVPSVEREAATSTILTEGQSGDDWGTEDMDDYFGGEPPDDDTDNEPPKLPEETSDPNFSSDYTDSGQQTITDQPNEDDKPPKKWHWIDDDRVPSQAEIDYYGAQDAGETPEITQAHLDEIAPGAGPMQESDFEDTESQEEKDDPSNQPVGPEYDTPEEDPLWTHSDLGPSAEDQIQTTPKDLVAESTLLTEPSTGQSGQSSTKTIGGGYSKQRRKEESRKHMNLTFGSNRSILTS